MSLPERVKLARTKRKLTQRALTDLITTKPASSYIAQLENGGIAKPSYEVISTMARVLDVPLSWLAEGAGDEPDWGPDETPDTERQSA